MSATNGGGDPEMARAALEAIDADAPQRTWELDGSMTVEQMDEVRRLRLDQLGGDAA